MNLIFLGPPGSGKGTQAAKLEKDLNIPKLSTGDMLRKAIFDKTPLGNQAKSIIDSGALVPDEIMINMITERISYPDCQQGFILDGFPRTIIQAEALDQTLTNLGKKIDLVLELKVDDNAIIERTSGRFSCAKCNHSYNKKYRNTKLPGICDECGSDKFIYREDDDPKAVANRLKAYHSLTEKLLPYYKNQGKLFTINGMEDIDEVSNKINLIIKTKSNLLT